VVVPDYRPLIAGVDTLEVGYSISGYHLTGDEWDGLEAAKLAAQSTPHKNDYGHITLRGQTFNVARGGAARYSYVLTNDDVRLRISENALGGQYYPEVHAAFNSTYLWREHWKGAAEDLESWISEWADVCATTIARSDLTLDVCGPMPTLSPEMREVVARARSRRDEGTLEFQRDRSSAGIETYRFGKNDLLGRIYDKRKETLVSHKDWFKVLWDSKGWGEDEPVTRVEFQCRRKFLRKYQVNTVADLDANMADVWKYLVEHWLTIRDIAQDGHRHRWPVSDFWQCVQNATDQFGTLSGVSRLEQTTPRLEVLVKQLRGLMVSVGAIGADGIGADAGTYGMGVIDSVVKQVMSDPGLEDRIAHRAARFSSIQRHTTL
jgi:hypothetical protein